MLEMEDLQSSLTCQGLTVTALKGKGRCLYTTKGFSPGLFSLRPHPCPLSRSNLSPFSAQFTTVSSAVDCPRWVLGMFVDIALYLVCE